MAIETQDIPLRAGVPVDLGTVAQVAAELASAGRAVLFIQNTTPAGTEVQIAERATADIASAGGHPMAAMAGFVVTVEDGAPFWCWSRTGGQVTITEASPDAD